jgi:2-polyprenyl-3-methyl-5-hydroxy-6-metoxy-1,4-benzoquinol methylase
MINNACKTLSCPICSSPSPFWKRSISADIYRCEACNHPFTDTDSIRVKETYDVNYYLKTHENWFKNPNIPLFQKLLRLIKSHHCKTVLDIGCGNGDFLYYLHIANPSLSLTGIDLSAKNLQKDQVTLIGGDFNHHQFNQSFDAVISLAFIEHIDKVDSFPQRIASLLNQNGIACIMTINETGLLYQIANFLKLCGVSSIFNRLYDPHHLNHFSQESLEKLFRSSKDLQMVEVIHHNAPIKSIDFPSNNFLIKYIYTLGVGTIFQLGLLLKKGYLQTLVVKKI